MKTILKIAMVGLMTAQGAQAMVVDKFDCSLSLTELESGKVTTSRQSVRLVRGRFETELPNTAMTVDSGNLSVEVKDGNRTILAKASLFFFHAVRFDASGRTVIDSRQQSCPYVTGGVCEKDVPCPLLGLSCDATRDPFDAATGWQKVKLIDNTQIPEFDARSVNSLKYDILDVNANKVASTNLKCTYLGTNYDAPSANIAE